MNSFVFAIHLASTAFMAGVIWFVQLIHYRWFHDVPASAFIPYHRKYTSTVGIIVGPAMLMEFASALYLLFFAQGPQRGFFIAGLCLLIVIWLSTALLQVPCHAKLAAGYSLAIHRRLVTTNWIRTIGWSARLVLLIVYSLVSAPLPNE